jgi:hypothetical protein
MEKRDNTKRFFKKKLKEDSLFNLSKETILKPNSNLTYFPGQQILSISSVQMDTCCW